MNIMSGMTIMRITEMEWWTQCIQEKNNNKFDVLNLSFIYGSISSEFIH